MVKNLGSKEINLNQYDFIAEKRASGATIMETIKFCMREYKISLAEAKEIVSAHPAWASVVEAAEPLHRSLDNEGQ